MLVPAAQLRGCVLGTDVDARSCGLVAPVGGHVGHRLLPSRRRLEVASLGQAFAARLVRALLRHLVQGALVNPVAAHVHGVELGGRTVELDVHKRRRVWGRTLTATAIGALSHPTGVGWAVGGGTAEGDAADEAHRQLGRH